MKERLPSASKRCELYLTIGMIGSLAACHGAAMPASVAPQAGSQAAAPGNSLLYVSNADNVSVYSYDDGAGIKQTGTLSVTEPRGLCSDKSGNVYITSVNQPVVYEFAHGATSPTRTIRRSSGLPYACAVDPATGNLAVTYEHPHGKFQAFATVVVFTSGSGRGTVYGPASGFKETYFAAYDNKSNLFVDASACSSNGCYYGGQSPQLFELAKSAGQFTQLTLKGATLHDPTGLDWIKPTLLVTDNAGVPAVGYQVLVVNGTATVVSTVRWKETKLAEGVSERADLVTVPDQQSNTVRLYQLSNGAPVASFTQGLSSPFSTVISQ